MKAGFVPEPAIWKQSVRISSWPGCKTAHSREARYIYANCVVATKDPCNDISTLKHNVGPKGQSWAFRLKHNRKNDLPTLEWLGSSGLTVEDLSGSSDRSTRRPKLDAKSFLERELKDGQKKARTLLNSAKAEGITVRTLKRAKTELGVVSKQKNGRWLWSLPPD